MGRVGGEWIARSGRPGSRMTWRCPWLTVRGVTAATTVSDCPLQTRHVGDVKLVPETIGRCRTTAVEPPRLTVAGDGDHGSRW